MCIIIIIILLLLIKGAVAELLTGELINEWIVKMEWEDTIANGAVK